MKITQQDLEELKQKADRAMAKVRGMRDKAESMTMQLVQTMEVGGTAFGFGILQGRTGGVEVIGVPVDLGAAFLLHLGGYVGAAGEASSHLHNIGDGAAASYLNTLGVGIGARMRSEAERAGGGTAAATPGATPASTTAPSRLPAGSASAGAVPTGAADQAMARALANMQRAA